MGDKAIVQKFIDDTDSAMDTAIRAFIMTHPECQLIENTHVVVKREIDPTKVHIICGGGAGHEPAHVGYVDKGWISAAVSGGVFASPPTSHVSAAIDYLHAKQGPNGPGILVVVKNYLGDILNFGFAVEEARQRGVRIEKVLAADDACFGVDDVSRRRGIAGSVLLYKILGAAAQRGSSLTELTELAHRMSAGMRSLGASLSSCALPGCKSTAEIPPNHVELGLGIHGERGLTQVKYEGVHQLMIRLVNILLDKGTTQVGADSQAWKNSHVALLVNNLGSTTDIEMGILTHSALHLLRTEGLHVVGISVGRYMTALEMHGFSLTLLRLDHPADVSYLFDDQQSPLMPFSVPSESVDTVPGPRAETDTACAESPSPLPCRVAEAVFRRLHELEERFNELDAAVGDGDLGSGVRRASAAALPLVPRLPWTARPDKALALLARAVAEAWGGTSGPLYGAFLLGAGAAGRAGLEKGAVGSVREALRGGSAEVQRIGGARQGERTMVDVLEAVNAAAAVTQAETLAQLARACVEAARRGAEEVAQMPAKHGRTRYMQGKEIGLRDPGAELVACWMEAAADVILQECDS